MDGLAVRLIRPQTPRRLPSQGIQLPLDSATSEERRYVLRLAEFPRWLRRLVGGIYLVWALAVTAFIAYVVIRALDFDKEVEPTTETVILLAGLLVAPLLPFAQRLVLPGGSVVDFNAEGMLEKGRAAGQGIAQASQTVELPPLGSEWEEGGGDA